MELLELIPSQFGVAEPGVYVVDDDGAQIRAGPFAAKLTTNDVDDSSQSRGRCWVEPRGVALVYGCSSSD